MACRQLIQPPPMGSGVPPVGFSRRSQPHPFAVGEYVMTLPRGGLVAASQFQPTGALSPNE